MYLSKGTVFYWISIFYVFGDVASERIAQGFMVNHTHTRSAMIAFAAANLLLLPPKIFLT